MEDIEKELKLSVLNELEDHITELSDVLNGKSYEDVIEEDIDLIFRIVHSVKGNTRACGYNELAEASHFFESKLMDAKLDYTRYDEKYHDLALSFLDLVSESFEILSKDVFAQIDISKLINELEHFETESSKNKVKNITKSKREGNFLLIDDDENILDIISEYIDDHFKATIKTELNGQDAIATSDEQKFDVIVCDYKMPFINGKEFIKMLRKSQNINKDTPIVFLSGYKPDLTEKQEIWNNVFFIDKPFAESKLIYYIKCSLELNKEMNVA